MKRRTTLVVGIIALVILAFYMLTYTVPFSHAAVVETFGRTDKDAVVNAEREAEGAGLYPKWPWPIQRVRLYDKRLQVLEQQIEQLQTSDQKNVIVGFYMTWRIDRPLDFHRTLVTVPHAERQLSGLLSSAAAALSQYSLDELTADEAEQSKLAEAEAKVRRRLQAALSSLREGGADGEDGTGYGVAIESVGIQQLKLAQDVTQAVLQSQKTRREAMAQTALSEGQARASRIESAAEQDAKIIRSFAEARARAIEAEGVAAAAEYYKTFNRSPELAVILEKFQTIRDTLGPYTTILLDTDVAPYDIFDRMRAPVPQADEAGDGEQTGTEEE